MNIVLVHGILGFSHLDVPLSPIEYFSGVAEFLREQFQAAVIAPVLDPTAGIETRSEMLRASIEAALAGDQLEPKEPIHIIAHSMGGLDSRRMITKGCVIEVNGEKTAVQTLATIGTPHRGSPVADLVALKFLDKIPFMAGALELLGGPDGYDQRAWSWKLASPRKRTLKDFRVGFAIDSPLASPTSDVKPLLEAAVAAVDRAGAQLKSGWPPGYKLEEALENYEFLLAAFTFSTSPKEGQEQDLQQMPANTPFGAGYRASHADWVQQRFKQLRYRAMW